MAAGHKPGKGTRANNKQEEPPMSIVKPTSALSKLRRRDVIAAAGAAATLPFTRRRARAADPIVFGWVGPLSPPGGYAEGTNMKYAAQMAVDEINAQGGLLGRPVQMEFADTRGMPAEGRSGAERLITQNKVVAITGEFHSGVAMAEMEVVHKYGIPIMFCDVWSTAITAKGYPEVFRNAPNVALIDSEIGKWMVAAGFKNVAILAEKDDVGLLSRQTCQAELDKAGVKYSFVDADPNLTDFTSQILRFKNMQPAFDFFIAFFPEAGAYPMVRQAHDLGFAPTKQCGMYNSGGSAVDPTYWENVGDTGKFLCTENVGVPKAAWTDKTKKFVADFQAKHKAIPSGAVMEGYDGAWLLFDAVRSSGSTDGKAIISALEKTNYVGVRGQYDFSTGKEPDWAYHQFMHAPLTILQYTEVKQDQSEAPIVWPRNWATVPWTYMKPT